MWWTPPASTATTGAEVTWLRDLLTWTSKTSQFHPMSLFGIRKPHPFSFEFPSGSEKD